MKQSKICLALPLKDRGDISGATEDFIRQCLQSNENKNAGILFGYLDRVGANAPWQTSQLAHQFRYDQPDCEWFFLLAGDVVTTVADIYKLVEMAQRENADIVGGIVIAKPKAEFGESGQNFRRMLTGNLPDDEGQPSYVARNKRDDDIRWFERGVEIKDDYVKKNLAIRCDIVGGGVALYHRRLIEELAPERNGGLPYFCYDKMDFSYDIRVFERAKEKGASCWCHCGVLMGHIGKDKFGNDRTWNFWDLPKTKEEKWIQQRPTPSLAEPSTRADSPAAVLPAP